MTKAEVPRGYDVERERGAIVVALPSVISDVCDAIRAAGTLYAAAAARPDAQAFSGRGNAYYMMTSDGPCVVRHYRRGGAAARVMTDEYVRIGAPRPAQELHASIAARRKGVDTPEVVAAVIYPAGPLYRGDIATRYIPQSRQLADVTITAQRADARTRLEAWRAAGKLLRTVFHAGVHHADLNLRNILIRIDESGDARALLLDLDKAVVRNGAVAAGQRAAMLQRLHRSRRKIEEQAEYETPADELAAFDAALKGT